MKVEKMFNMLYGVSIDHATDKRLPLKYQPIDYLFDVFNAGTKAIILEDMEIDFELVDEAFIFTIEGERYSVHSDDMDYKFFRGTYKAKASKIE